MGKTKKQIKKEIKAENKEIKDAVIELNNLNPHEVVLENNKIVRISIIAKYNKTDIEISCKLYEDLPIITAQLMETDRSYYIDEVEDFFGNKMNNLNSNYSFYFTIYLYKNFFCSQHISYILLFLYG